MASNINPRIDLVFKKIFGVEENKDLLIALINSIVSEEDQVADIVLLNPYSVQNFITEKSSILDIKAKGVDDPILIYRLKSPIRVITISEHCIIGQNSTRSS
jgi:hypothetical protein